MLMLQNDQVIGGVDAAPSARQRPHWSEALVHPVRSFHTVRHLETKQLVYRAVRLVQPSAIAAGGEGDGVLRVRRASPAASMPDAAFDGGSFCFLNRRLPWGGPDRWHPRAADDLWIFNLHYFRFLADLDVATARELILDWIAANRPGGGAAWHPYTISIRVREWTEWLLAHPDAPEPLAAAMIGSIREQVNRLSHRLEFQVMGNHLLENAITLCWAGLSFADRQSEAWLTEGAALLVAELRRQVLADGAHDERSPMYQAVLTESLLRLAEIAADAPGATAATVHNVARDAGRKMLESLRRMTHPDGGYALLNDTAAGVAPSLSALLERFATTETVAAGSSPRGWSLPDAGYSGYRAGDDMYVVFDAGPIGPDHQPGHGHADMLSFELSARGRRVVTDTGVLTYAVGAARRHDRSTAAHNTIEIDGRDQSEVWGAFRCGRRSSIVAAGADESRDGIMLSGAYRGKGRRGAGTVRHQRQLFVNRRLLAFTDTVTAAGQHDATLRLHLAPGTHVKRSGSTCIIVDEQRRPMATLAGDGVDWVESSSPYHPQFGIETARPCLIARTGFRNRLVVKWWLILN